MYVYLRASYRAFAERVWSMWRQVFIIHLIDCGIAQKKVPLTPGSEA